MNLAQTDFEKIRRIIRDATGIALKGDKLRFLDRRVQGRIKELNLKTVRDYLRYLDMDNSGGELSELVNLVVVGETYFFREYFQLELFAERILPETCKKKRAAGNRGIRVLSAGCATGEEPYTLAIILREMLEDFSNWQIEIQAVDINPRSLEKAQAGFYAESALRETPTLYRAKYFTRKEDGFEVRREIKNMVTFTQMNLRDPNQTALLTELDFVFCKNMLIYFDKTSAGIVLRNLHRSMKPGGYIFLGAAESVGRVCDLFRPERFGKRLVYRK